jgi:hypothetical protein
MRLYLRIASACFAWFLIRIAPVAAIAQATAPQETMVVLPFKYTHGTHGGIQTAHEFLASLLVKASIDQVTEEKVAAGWKTANGDDYDSNRPALPTPAQMLRTGRQLGADWVMAGSVDWHSRSIWIGLGPKTKSTAVIHLRIVNVRQQTTDLEVQDLHMDSTAKEDVLKTLGTVFLTSMFTVVSGGPKTPHEQRAVELGLAKALEPWLVQHLKEKKIDPAAR